MDNYTHTTLTNNSTHTEKTHIGKASLAMPMFGLLFAFLFIVCVYYQPFRNCTKRGIRSVRRWDRLSRRKIRQWNNNLCERHGRFQKINNLPNRNTYELDELQSVSDWSFLSSSSSSSSSFSPSFLSSISSSSYLEHASGSESSLVFCPIDESNTHHDADYDPDYSGFTSNQGTWSSQDTTLVNPAELPPGRSDQIAEDSHATSPNTRTNDDVDAVVFLTAADSAEAQWEPAAYIREAHGPGAFVERFVDWAVQQFMGGAADNIFLRHQPVPSGHVPSAENDHEDSSLAHAA
ncbi:hypothetical protein N7510_004955 [Penicillium lagena]|uniref:uncharacterized protein n=1 Tax=Penicillium lagena TaxID=94218 RepID=UPI0025424FF1|nr:uncharacterized protein N7510_004955 [Penicillium lagena]KAJ5620971.1 hypothetical protein N7510_004955 [Penicillium lagena]